MSAPPPPQEQQQQQQQQQEQALRSGAVWGKLCPRMQAALAADAEAVEALTQALAQKDADLQSTALAREQEAAALQQARAELSSSRAAEDGLRREVAALSAKLQVSEAESADRAKALEVLTRELAGKSCEIQTKSQAVASKDAALQQAITELGSSRKKAEDLESHLADVSGKLRASEEEAAARARQVEDQSRALARKESDLQYVRQEKAHKEARLQEALAEADRLRKLVEHLDGRPTAGPCAARLPVGVLDTGRYIGAKPLDFYDAVLAISSLEDIYLPGKGWQVQVTNRRAFDFGAPCAGVRVIPIGQFNSGKTWLIAQLSGVELPKGVSVHTEGISMKEAAADNLPIILLDTVGTNSPMDALPHGVQAHDMSNGVEAVLQELRAQEEFYRQVCFAVGQVILFVVAQMSHKDQMDLVRLARAIRKDRVRKDIIVVHNLREWDVATLLQKSPKDRMNYVERNQKLFGLTDGSLDVTIGAETRRVIRHQGLFKGESDSRDIVVSVYHYYLTSHNLPCSGNNFAIQDMRATITRSDCVNKPLAEELATAASKVQSRFASFNMLEPQIVFDRTASRFHTRDPVPTGAYRLKPRDLGSYFTMGSDDPDYNIMLLPGIVKKQMGRGDVKDQERKAYQLQIELPGLSSESLADIRKQFESKDKTSALRRESVEGEKGQQWTVSFQATLMNVPAALYAGVADATSQEVDLLKEVSVHEVADSGSRKHFLKGERTVKVTLRTGIMDYDTSEDPVVTYVDGVLGITLMKQRWC